MNWLFLLLLAEDSREAAGYILAGLLVAEILLFGTLIWLIKNRFR